MIQIEMKMEILNKFSTGLRIFWKIIYIDPNILLYILTSYWNTYKNVELIISVQYHEFTDIIKLILCCYTFFIL